MQFIIIVWSSIVKPRWIKDINMSADGFELSVSLTDLAASE